MLAELAQCSSKLLKRADKDHFPQALALNAKLFSVDLRDIAEDNQHCK